MLPAVISAAQPLVLGSASPRRRRLLEQLGLPLRVIAADVDERPAPAETPDTYLERVTLHKLAAVGADPRAPRGAIVLTADTIVLLDGEMLGKPSSRAAAREVLSRLSGRAHVVRTCFALGRAGPGASRLPIHMESVSTVVCFRALDPVEITAYADTGEGADKAGAYAIQGVGSFAVPRIEGSYSNVVGLPLCEVVVALKRHGF